MQVPQQMQLYLGKGCYIALQKSWHPGSVDNARQQLLHQIVWMQGREGGRKGESQAGKRGSTKGEGGRLWQTLCIAAYHHNEFTCHWCLECGAAVW